MNTIKSVFDEAFRQYGRVLMGVDLTQIVEAMKQTDIPDDVVYVPGLEILENTDFAEYMEEVFFGGSRIQVGYCNGHNLKLNALEYHRSSEVNVACTDMILMLGRQQDIKEDYTYDTSLVETFFVPKNTAIEMYATTLHYAPCSADEEGFRCVVVLPYETNYELDREVAKVGEDRLLAAKNKWLIAHEDAKIPGAFNGLKGTNLEL